jgi:hypothetical protein
MTLEPDRSRGRATPAQLLVYGFVPGGEFEGRLVGAIERIESGGTLRVVDVLFVMRDADTEELVAIERRGRGAGSLVAPLLGFRLDPGERRRVSEKSLRAGEHVWVRALDDAVSRTGGSRWQASSLTPRARQADC